MAQEKKGATLFDAFPPVPTEQWEEKIVADLKGADYQRKLVWRTAEGFDVRPYYRAEDISRLPFKEAVPGTYPYVRGSREKGNTWEIRQDILVDPDPRKTNRTILHALEKGAHSVGLVFRDVQEIDRSFLKKLLTKVEIDCLNLHFLGYSSPEQLYRLFLEHAEDQEKEGKNLTGSLDTDPLGRLALTGSLNEKHWNSWPALVGEAAGKTPGFRILGINGKHFHNSGATLSQEIAISLSMANACLTQGEAHGLDPKSTARGMMFNLATGPDYFPEIAKLRALRMLWSYICTQWGIPAEKIGMHVHSETVRWNLTVYDPYVNILRTTTEAMSAGLAGSDSVTVLPFDTYYKGHNDFSDRIARNIQIILQEEAYFNKVADPAAGSYYLENLTAGLAEKAWELFREIESRGGFLEAFKTGFIQDTVEASARRKRERVAARKETLVGINQYPNFDEQILEQYRPASPERNADEEAEYRPLKQLRLAKAFEKLRMQTEQSEKRPAVFLFKYGNPAWMTARAMFSGNFFACAGYEILDNAGFATVEEGIEAARKSGAEIIALCSSDDAYPEMVPQVAEALRESAHIVVAGYPKEHLEQLREAGAEHFIHVKSNLLEELTKFQQLLGIPEKSE